MPLMRWTMYGSGYKVFENGDAFNLDGSPKKWSKSKKGYMYSRFSQVDRPPLGKTQHRLVAELFLPKVEGKNEVDHIDGDRANNHISNLRWVTHGENVQHSYTSGRRDVSGARNANCKYTEDQIRRVCELLVDKVPYPSISKETGVKVITIGAVKKRRQWTDISSSFDF